MSTNPFDMFSKVFGDLEEKNRPGEISDKRKIELQYQMILELKARGERQQKIIDKLNVNNTKIIAQVQKLTTRVGALEAAAAHDVIDVTPKEES